MPTTVIRMLFLRHDRFAELMVSIAILLVILPVGNVLFQGD